MKAILTSILLALTIWACTSQKDNVITHMPYPNTAKVDTTEAFFGVTIADPYRWLENDTSQQTAAWVKAQNEVTDQYLEGIPYRAAVRARLENLFNYERLGAPTRHGDYYYFFKNDGLQNQSVCYRRKGKDGTPEVYLDPNTFSTDGTTRLAGLSFSKDGSRLAYQVSKSGSDWNDAIIVNAVTQQVLEDTLHNLKFTGLDWQGNEGFYYSAYPETEGSKLLAKAQNQKLYYHQVGTPRTDDKLVFGDDENPKRSVQAGLTDDEQYLIITASDGTSGNELYVQSLASQDSPIVQLVDNQENDHDVIGNIGNKLLIQTNLQAPNKRLVIVDMANPTPAHWQDLIAETPQVASFSYTGGKIFAHYTIDVKSAIKQFDETGRFEHEVKLPGMGAAEWGRGRPDDKEVFYAFTSFLYPTTIFRYDIASGESTLYAQPQVDFKADDYEMKQVFYTSKDSTRVPMYILYKKGLALNGKNPTMLYGYGGFDISLMPGFNPAIIAWLENGGVYAQPNLRGGGEYGETWHKAGTKMEKQNVFDDFIAAAEYLIAEQYTAADYLAIQGRSNGGLLVGACMTQRPDLFKVALPGVGVMDMLRYHQFSAGPFWAADYGRADDSREMFEYLLGYSPLHNIKPGVAYPATLVTTADHDDRVVPAHSFKFAATLQEHHKGEDPVLIRIETKSAHGASNLSKTIDLYSDLYAFTWYNMGVLPEVARKSM